MTQSEKTGVVGAVAVNRGVSPGCKRINVDLPLGLWERVKGLADEPPAVPVTEWVRRVIAHHAGFPMLPVAERRRGRLRLTGEPKLRPGGKRRG